MPTRSGLLAITLAVLLHLPGSRAVPLNETHARLPGPVTDPNAIGFLASDERLGPGILQCPCSPSERGFRGATVSALVPDSLVSESPEPSAEPEVGSLSEGAAEAGRKAAEGLLRACAHVSGIEACINLAARLRRPGEYALCMHDTDSGKNVVRRGAGVVTVGSCALDATTRSPDDAVSDPEAGPQVGMEPGPDARPGGERSAEDPEASDAPMDEGCVALEHLVGAALQHRKPLRRPVLCGRGFCATPNHDIEVDGVRTSMRELCSPEGKWQCVRSVKLVNNLKIARHTRWRVRPNLVVTPYDRRFPPVLSWIAQLAQDSWRIVANATVLGVALVLALNVAARSKTKQTLNE